MEITNLRLTLNASGTNKHRLEYTLDQRVSCSDTLCCDSEMAQYIAKVLPQYDSLRNERDNAKTHLEDAHRFVGRVCSLLNTHVSMNYETLITPLGELVGTINGLKQLLELPEDASNTSIFRAVEVLQAERGATPETRYIVHGDIRPCVVLYSDETTTLVRLPNDDMMCETSTIEWSDELTYRCQELLRSAGYAQTYAVKALASLVANGALHFDDSGADPAYFEPAPSDKFVDGKEYRITFVDHNADTRNIDAVYLSASNIFKRGRLMVGADAVISAKESDNA